MSPFRLAAAVVVGCGGAAVAALTLGLSVKEGLVTAAAAHGGKVEGAATALGGKVEGAATILKEGLIQLVQSALITAGASVLVALLSSAGGGKGGGASS
ncbi:hypothetical protein HYH02_014447 [Chlamydomonas schloesseri]|uniref:Uncharacterized protein n=1 Tax=Chlamydomonas schloesseri TaxID=2026947 RepID=A0A835VWI0_9CHLO|nr:hypothetical protein HYH02_014447 [Chlamydomonas schloesseri]|eukprot:KAG2428099.1 hypothetical protein HYH02_014447 [Chlamydomonas schloesseri]